MEEKHDRDTWRSEKFQNEAGMTFEQLNDKYNYHYDRLVELRSAYSFITAKYNICELFNNNKDDGIMILLRAAKYLADCIDLERAAFSWIKTTLCWSKYDTDNYDLSHEIIKLYDLSCAQESEARELLKGIKDMCGEACDWYMSRYAKFTDDEMCDAMQKAMNCQRYHLDVPEKPKFSMATYPSKYFSHKEGK